MHVYILRVYVEGTCINDSSEAGTEEKSVLQVFYNCFTIGKMLGRIEHVGSGQNILKMDILTGKK